MKARYFTYGEKPKAVYYLTDIKGELFPNHTAEQFYEEIETKWLKNPDLIIVDDRQNPDSNSVIEMNQIEKYLDKLEELRKQLEEDETE
jgi:hypothetical protein